MTQFKRVTPSLLFMNVFPLYSAFTYWYIAISDHSYWNTASLPIIKAATPKRTFQGTLDFTYSNSVYCKMIITGQRVRRFPSPYGKKEACHITISMIAVYWKNGDDLKEQLIINEMIDMKWIVIINDNWYYLIKNHPFNYKSHA